MSLLPVSNDINHHGNFKGKSRVTRQVKIVFKSRITLQCPITPQAADLGPITYLGPIMRHGKPLCHPA